jgi:hypothetical protein
MGLRIDKVIADQMVMVMMTNHNDSVKIMQAEEARKEKSTPPEWIRDPCV